MYRGGEVKKGQRKKPHWLQQISDIGKGCIQSQV